MIKLFPLSDVSESIFCWEWGASFLAEQGITLTKKESECDLYVSKLVVSS